MDALERKRAQRERDTKAGHIRWEGRINPEDKAWFNERAKESREGRLKK